MPRGARLGGRARPNDEGGRSFFSKAAATWSQPRHPAATAAAAPLACPGSATASGSAGGGLRAWRARGSGGSGGSALAMVPRAAPVAALASAPSTLP